MRTHQRRLADVSRCTGVPPARLARAMDRGILKLRGGDKESANSGDHRQFSAPRIVQIALAKSLSALGIGAARAYAAAARFTDEGSPGRKPNELFETGLSWLVVANSGATVLNLPPGALAADLISGHLTGDRAEAVVIVDVGSIKWRIEVALNATQP